jgi:hypothetical protein
LISFFDRIYLRLESTSIKIFVLRLSLHFLYFTLFPLIEFIHTCSEFLFIQVFLKKLFIRNFFLCYIYLPRVQDVVVLLKRQVGCDLVRYRSSQLVKNMLSKSLFRTTCAAQGTIG